MTQQLENGRGLILPPLYPILDASVISRLGESPEQSLRSLMAELVSAGITLLQYRNKRGNEAEILADALILRSAAPLGKCTLILNDHPALAVRAGFDGAHIGQLDMPVEEARTILGPDRILGVSTHNPEQLRTADATSANYLAIGPIFATTSKENPDPVVGIEGLRHGRQLTSKPLVAIGGITLENCSEVVAARADSIAVISSLFGRASNRQTGKLAREFLIRLRSSHQSQRDEKSNNFQ